jgi:hypothetical protein
MEILLLEKVKFMLKHALSRGKELLYANLIGGLGPQ